MAWKSPTSGGSRMTEVRTESVDNSFDGGLAILGILFLSTIPATYLVYNIGIWVINWAYSTR